MNKCHAKVSLVSAGLAALALGWTGGVSPVQANTLVNLPLLNGSFESPTYNGTANTIPTNWGFFSSGPQTVGITSAEFLSGSQSLILTAPPSSGGNNQFDGIYQSFNNNLTYAPTDTYTFSTYLLADSAAPLTGTAVAEIGIEFHTSSGLLNQSYLTITPSELSATTWTQFTVTGSPSATEGPTNGADINVVIMVNGGSATTSGGSFYADDATAAVPEPATLPLALMGLASLALIVRRKIHRA